MTRTSTRSSMIAPIRDFKSRIAAQVVAVLIFGTALGSVGTAFVRAAETVPVATWTYPVSPTTLTSAGPFADTWTESGSGAVYRSAQWWSAPVLANSCGTFTPKGAESNPTRTMASFSGPSSLAFDSSGNLYVADTNNWDIRKITAAGVVSTFVGAGFGHGPLAAPEGLAFDASGNLFVGEGNTAEITEVTPARVVTTFAGNHGSFENPHNLAFDMDGNLFVAYTYENKIREISPSGVVTDFVGSGAFGSTDGTGVSASFDSPNGLAFDSSGDLYVADSLGEKIREVTPAGVVTTFAGSGAAGSSDGIGTAASFNHPWALAFDSSGDLYVADGLSNKIRKVTPTGLVSTFAGSGLAGATDGTGVVAAFNRPDGLAFDSSSNLYVADGGGNKIRETTPAGVVTTFAGSGAAGAVDGSPGGSASTDDGGFNVVNGRCYELVLTLTDASGNSATYTSPPVMIDNTPAATGATYHAVPPTRLLDSRFGNGISGAFRSHVARTFALVGRGIPSSAVAVTGNLTVTGQTAAGYLYLGPDALNDPTSSTLNFPLGDNRANGVTVALGAGGSLSVTYVATPGATTQVVFDVTGYFSEGLSGAAFVPIAPARIADSRRNQELAPLKPGIAQTFELIHQGGIPAEAVAVSGNLTVASQTAAGYFAMTPTPTDSPMTSTLNFPLGDVRANGVTVALASGSLSVTYIARSGASAQVVFDATGYYIQ